MSSTDSPQLGWWFLVDPPLCQVSMLLITASGSMTVTQVTGKLTVTGKGR